MSAPEAFLLLTLANTTLSTSTGSSESGILNLECITIQIPGASTSADRDVYLILRLNSIETPIDPARTIHRTDGSGWRTYSFHGTDADPTELTVTIWPPTPSNSNSGFLEDLETFEGILAQYADLRGSSDSVNVTNPIPTTSNTGNVIGSDYSRTHSDLRGQLVVVNEDTGEVVGQFDDGKFKVQEDPRLREKGHENDAVVIEIPEPSDDPDDDANALKMFIRAVPPDQQDWITKSATIVSHAISTTTSLLLTTITTASSYYIAHSAPSPHNPTRAIATGSPSSTTSPVTPPPLPPRALVFLTSARTRKGLANVHAVSGQAVKVSAKTVSLIDSMIRRAMGAKPKRQRQFLTPSTSPVRLSPVSGMPPALPPRTPSPSAPKSHLAPPGYFDSTTSGSPFPRDKPALPPRRSTSPVPPSLPPRTNTGIPDGVIHAPQPRLSTKDRVLLSADLILSTIDHSTRQLLDTGTTSLGAVVGHKYGPDAAQSSLLMAGTARNVGLVYIDMRGIGRKALLKRAGKTFVKARVSSNRQ
ncbi:hypothetical protein BDZ94DRAFT_1256212 [Collybia nuda]|uniref:Senescence domain-containing protein n=1 Tax=Collybia nuda TaxID=64659 RepID=A0A9P5YB54_9AGAR|nr:hypothetical protein BDZ94DRAFT_1256212 [Collybia nuda]